MVENARYAVTVIQFMFLRKDQQKSSISSNDTNKNNNSAALERIVCERAKILHVMVSIIKYDTTSSRAEFSSPILQ